MANCEQYWELISASLDDALTSEERRRLEAHLAECPECRAMWEELSGLEAELMELEAPSDGFVDRVMDRAAGIEQDIPFTNLPQNRPVERQAREHLRAWWRPIRNLGALAACCLLVFGLGMLVLRSGFLGGSSSDSASNGAAAPSAGEWASDSAADAESTQSCVEESQMTGEGESIGSTEPEFNGMSDGAGTEQAMPPRNDTDGTENQNDAPVLRLDGAVYAASDGIADTLPEGFTLAGTLTGEQAGDTGLDGCEYYANPDVPGEVYVYQQCGAPDSTQPQWAYVRWVETN